MRRALAIVAGAVVAAAVVVAVAFFWSSTIRAQSYAQAVDTAIARGMATAAAWYEYMEESSR